MPICGPKVMKQPLSRCVACSPHNADVPQKVELALGEPQSYDLFLSQICVGSFTQECLDTCGRNVVLELLNNQLKLIRSNDRGLAMDLVWSKLTMTSVGTSA
jgi:hypothetical protein